MRPVVVTAILLPVVLMFMSHSAALPIGSLDTVCSTPTECEEVDDEGWIQFGEDRCLKVFHTEYLSFKDAEEACMRYTSQGNFTGHLVSIHNPEELKQVECAVYKATPGYPYWIGLYLSFHYEDLLVYDWTDGTQQDFINFAPHEPDFQGNAEDCVENNYNYWGQWNDLNCNFARPYVCAVQV